MIRNAFFAGLATVLMAVSANASVIFGLAVDPATTAGGTGVTSTRSGAGTWQLYAVDDSNADFGISGYNIAFNAATVGAINHRTPNGNATDGNGDPQSAGFSGLRSGTNVNPMVASQGLPGTTPFLINGFGQTAGTLAAKVTAIDPAGTVTPTSSGSWGNYTVANLATSTATAAANGHQWLLMAEGTYTGQIPTFASLVTTLTATTYVDSATHASAAATTSGILIPAIPEPASISLLGLAMIGGLGYFRRKR